MTNVRHAGASRNSCLLRNGRDRPANQKFNENIRVCEIQPSGAPGEFTAKINGELLVWSSRTPLLDAARALLGKGADSNSWLILRHAGSNTDCLRGKLGILARLAVREGNEAPRFAAWKPHPCRAVGAPIASAENSDLRFGEAAE